MPGSTRQRLKALSPVHRLQAAPGSQATRLDCWSLHAERGKHKDSCISQHREEQNWPWTLDFSRRVIHGAENGYARIAFARLCFCCKSR